MTVGRTARILDRCLEPRRFGSILVLLSCAICLWYLPYGLPTPDAGGVLVQAAKISYGAVFYRDIDAYPFPAASYLLAAAMHLFGERLEVARVFAALTFTGILLAGYNITRILAGRGPAALCGLWLLSLKFFAYPAFHDAHHADVALLFALWSMFVFLRFRHSSRSAALLAAGLLIGMTVLCKQNLGIYLGAFLGALVLMRRSNRHEGGRSTTRVAGLATFAAAAAAPIVAAAIYFQVHGVLGQMLYSGFVRPFSGYMPTSGLEFSVPLQWWNFGTLKGQAGFAYSVGPLFSMLGMGKLPLHSWYPVFWMAEELMVRIVYTAIPVVFAASAVAVALNRRRPPGHPQAAPIACLAILTLAVLASAFPRADYYHIIDVYPAILVLAFVAGANLVEHARAPQLAAAVRIAATSTTAVVFLASLLMTAWFFRGMTFETGNERGRMRIDPENAWIDDVVRYLDANLRDNDSLFVYGHEAYYYFFSGHYASWPFVHLYPGMTGDDDARLLAATLAQAPPRLIVKGLIGGWPGLPSVESYAGQLKRFVDTHYQATAKPFSDGLGPDATAPPGWLFMVMEPRRAD